MTGTGRRALGSAAALLALSVTLAVGPVGPVGPVGATPARPPAADHPDPWTYRPPVDAPVVDPFRPPPQPWAPGNRGLKYASVPGTPVRAIGPGVVTFAGPVAGTLHVTVAHPDGLRSSYSFVAAVRVAVDQQVAAGDVVAVGGEGLHLGVRRGDDYLDPASLWGRRVGPGRPVLVPDRPDGAPGREAGPHVGERPPSPPGPPATGPGGLVRGVARVARALTAAGRPG